MIENDLSLRRRVSDLENRLSSLQSQLDTRTSRPPVMGFPRDRWLGETVANGQTYPETGNTFFVKLLSCAFAPEFPGDSTVTQRDRGTIVLARTWPEVYLAEGDKVFVDRIKGVGDGGSWWIHANDPSGIEYARLYGGSAIAYPYGAQSIALGASGTTSVELLANTVDLNGNQIADGVAMGNVGESLGTRLKITKAGTYSVAAQYNVHFATLVPDGGGSGSMGYSMSLDVRQNNNLETILQGTDNGAPGVTTVGGIGSQYATAHVLGVIGCNSNEVVNFWCTFTRSYATTVMARLVNWNCLLTRLDD